MNKTSDKSYSKQNIELDKEADEERGVNRDKYGKEVNAK